MKLIFFLLILPVTVKAQEINFEQKAFEYFFGNIFERKYPGVKTIQFDGNTEKELSEFSLFTDCFKDEDPVWKKLYESAYGKLLPKKSINVAIVRNVSFKTRKVKSKIKLHILQATQVKGKFYVTIGLVKHAYYTHAYFFEFDESGSILRWCETGMTH